MNFCSEHSMLFIYHILFFHFGISLGQLAVCDQQQLTNYLSCVKTVADAAVQFLAVKESGADFVTALNGCFSKYGCNVPSTTTKNSTNKDSCRNAIVQDANVAQAFAKCFQYKNFTLPAITSLTFPAFNIGQYSRIEWIRNVKMNCKSNRVNERQATQCVQRLFSNHSQGQQHVGNAQIKQIFRIKKKRACNRSGSTFSNEISCLCRKQQK